MLGGDVALPAAGKALQVCSEAGAVVTHETYMTA
jgi:hypothetical protein